MTGRWLRSLLAVFLGVLASAPALLAEDWPCWGRTSSRNMVSAEQNLPETFVPGEKKPHGEGIDLATARNVKWAARIGNFSCGTPTVAHGK
ncbi:MAG: pyrrolo-quinoline quinone, partial [Verrucomicrobia bacterium]|nr:pyrrolo-quinoline quinone [Verrucomicrobiota bacterium]